MSVDRAVLEELANVWEQGCGSSRGLAVQALAAEFLVLLRELRDAEEEQRLVTEDKRYARECELRLTSERDQAVAALREMAAYYGAAHVDECPADDTCDCEMKSFNDRVNAACRLADGESGGVA